MNSPLSGRTRLGRFGFDPATGELWPLEGEGTRVILARQPFQVLQMLLDRSGQIVTREEIRNRLWHDETTVDFDHSINVAIRTLRRALGDSAESPRYIETLARRGYRLIVSPERLLEAELPQAAPERLTEQRQGAETHPRESPPVSGSQVAEVSLPFPYGREAWIAGALLLAIAVVLLSWTIGPRPPRFGLAPSDTIVIAVANRTSDPVFNDALYIGLLTSLEQTPYVNVLAVNKVAQALGKLGIISDPTRISIDQARRVCLATGSRLLLAAFITEAGNNFRIDQEAQECQSGRTVAHLSAEATSRSSVIQVLGAAIMRLRLTLGEPKSSVAKFNQPLEVATSSSPDALQLLTDGYRHSLLADFGGAIKFYQRATQTDPKLAMAYVALAGAEGSAGRRAEAASAATMGYGLRDRLTAPLRYNAEDVYYLFATGELEKRCDVLSRFAQAFPNNHTGHFNLAECMQSLGKFDAALAESRESARLLASSVSYGAILRNAILAGRYDEARAAYDAAAAHHFDAEPLREDRFLLAFLQSDRSAMQEQAAWAAQHPEISHGLVFEQALFARSEGRIGEYHRLASRAINSAVQADAPLDAAGYKAEAALYASETGDKERALREAAQCLKGPRTRETTLLLALVLARSGKTEQARDIAAQIGANASKDTLVQNVYLPSIEASMRFQQNDPGAAIAELRRASPYDFAFISSFANLYPSYLRGLAYLKTDQSSLALAEFRKVLSHPGLEGLSPIHSIAQVQLARIDREEERK